MSTIECVMFDVDGVLIRGYHHNPKFRRWWSENIEADLGINPEELSKKMFIEGPWDKVIRGQLDTKEAFGKILPELGYQGDVDAYLNYWHVNDLQWNQETLALAQEIRRVRPEVKLLVTTNQDHSRGSFLAGQSEISELFDRMYYAAQLGVCKHEASFFSRVLLEMRLSPENCLVIDDSPKVISAAEAFHMQTFLFEEPEESCKQLRELLQLS